jgi:DNA-binding CsgD family transcriptional regulator
MVRLDSVERFEKSLNGVQVAQLTKEEIVTLQTLRQKGQSGRAIARQLKVTEGTVRYHLRRKSKGAVDGRQKQSLIELGSLAGVVRHWWQAQLESLPSGRAPNIHQLWQFLMEDY